MNMYINHIFTASPKDLTACLGIAQLLVEGGSLLEADSVVLVVVGASDRHCPSLDLSVEPNWLVRVAFNGERMGCYLGCIFVVDNAQLERVSVVQTTVVVGSSVRVHWLAMRGMCVSGVVFRWLWQVELLLIGN
jgi:hypothetical protein